MDWIKVLQTVLVLAVVIYVFCRLSEDDEA